MVEGRDEAEWTRLSLVNATIVNANPWRRRGQVAKMNDFNPYRRKKRGVRLTKKTMALFKSLVLGPGKRDTR